MMNLPASLFKYMHPDRRAFFNDWLIRFSQPAALNDPFEMRPYVDGFQSRESQRESLRRQVKSFMTKTPYKSPLGRKIDEEFLAFSRSVAALPDAKIDELLESGLPTLRRLGRDMVSELTNKEFVILCLCEHPDSLLMWAHYANGHRGFVLEFDSASPFFSKPPKTTYSRVTKEVETDFSDKYGKLWPVRYSGQRHGVLAKQTPFELLSVKSKEWEYESEWRLLMPPACADKTLEQVNDYPVCLFAVPPATIRRVILGCNADKNLEAAALSLRNNPISAHIEVERASIDERCFALNFLRQE